MARRRKVHTERLWLVVEKTRGVREPYMPVVLPGYSEKQVRRERHRRGKWVKRLRPLLNGSGELHSLEKHVLAEWHTVSVGRVMSRLVEEVAEETKLLVREQHLLLRRRQYAARVRARKKRVRTHRLAKK